MIFDDAFIDSLPAETAQAVLEVFRHFRDFNTGVLREEAADSIKLIADHDYGSEVFENYLRAYSFLQSFVKAHDLNVNISGSPLSPSDLMDRRAFVDRVRDAYVSLEAIYFKNVASLTREQFEAKLGGKQKR